MKPAKLIILLLALFALRANAQNIPAPLQGKLQQYIDGLPAEQQFVNIVLENESIGQWASKYLLSNAPQGYGLGLTTTRQSPDGMYYTFDLNFSGTLVFGRSAKVFADNKGIVRYIYHNLGEFVAPASHTLPGEESMDTYYRQTYPALELKDKGALWVNDGSELLPAFYLTLKDHINYTINKQVFDVLGRLLYTYPMYSRFAGNDTPVHAYVYDPDPLTTAHVFYGGNYSNNGGLDNPQLQAELRKRTIRGTLQNDSVLLSNSRFDQREVTGPYWNATKIHIGDTLRVSRNDNRFCDVNAYYHLNTFSNYVHSLGYTGLPGFLIQVDAHAFNGGENSQFTPGDNPASLQFGDGGIPDAEDAEVVVHEFGHALSYGASPNTGVGQERLAIDEGLGDYFAVSYTKAIDDYNWPKVFSWDGNNGGWQGRTVAYTQKYPDDLTGSKWKDGQFWGTSFITLYNDIGKDIADRLMLETLYRLASNMTMPLLARAVLQIDTIKYNGVHHDNIVCAFAKTGILQSTIEECTSSVGELIKKGQKEFKVYNTLAFAEGKGEALVLTNTYKEYTLRLTDINGRELLHEVIGKGQNASISSQNLATGVYFLHLSGSGGLTEAFKMVRY